MLSNLNPSKVWTLNIGEYLLQYSNKISKKKFKTPSSVHKTTSTIKDSNKLKNQNKNAHLSTFLMILIKLKPTILLLRKKSPEKIKKLLIWAKHSQDNSSKIYKIKPLIPLKILLIIMYPAISKKVKKVNPSISIKSLAENKPFPNNSL